MAASWLKDAVFYEIYPQTFRDSNGDGIGDLQGIIEKLPYVKSLGCNAIWMNPCFDSPFKDGGYDVRDYKKVAERYGTNEDLVCLFDEAHKLGIRILLDLVPATPARKTHGSWSPESPKPMNTAPATSGPRPPLRAQPDCPSLPVSMTGTAAMC